MTIHYWLIVLKLFIERNRAVWRIPSFNPLSVNLISLRSLEVREENRVGHILKMEQYIHFLPGDLLTLC